MNMLRTQRRFQGQYFIRKIRNFSSLKINSNTIEMYSSNII